MQHFLSWTGFEKAPAYKEIAVKGETNREIMAMKSPVFYKYRYSFTDKTGFTGS